MQKVRTVVLPEESRIVCLYKLPELADAFAITLPPEAPDDITRLARILFANPACWFRCLLTCRDALVRPFGIRTSAQLRDKLMAEGALRIDFFPVLSVKNSELIIGHDDCHLDFRTSVLVRQLGHGKEREVVMTSVVRCHNRTGRLYTWLIAPFHRAVVSSMLRRASDRQWR